MGAERTSGNDVSLWKGTDYGWWLVSDTAGALCDSIVAFAVPMIVLSLTGSPSMSSAAQGVWVAMQVALMIPGGVVQDTYDRRKLMIWWGGSGAALCALAAFSLSGPGFGWPVLVAVACLLGVRDGIVGNTSNAMLRGVVPDEQLPHAMSLNSARDSLVGLIGGPCAGLLLAVGRTVPFVAGCALGAASVASTWRIHRYWKRDEGAAAKTPDADTSENGDSCGMRHRVVARLSDACSGLRWLLTDGFQRRLTISAAVVVGGGNSFLLLMMMQISQGGSRVLTAGVFDAIASAGMLVGAVVASFLIDRVPSGLIVGAMFGVLGVGFICASIVPSLIGKAVCVCISLSMLPVGNAVLGGLSNVLVDKGKLGRVGAGRGLLQYGVYAVMVTISGAAVERWGYGAAGIGLAACVAVAAAYAVSSRSLITFPAPDGWKQHVERCGIARLQ